MEEDNLPETAEPPPSRSDELLERLGVDPATFKDPGLPNGVFSHSQYQNYKICGEAYRFKYVENVRSPSSGRMARGSAVHKGVEFMLLEKMAKRHLSVEKGEAVVADAFEKSAADVQNWDPEEPKDRLKDTSLALFRVYSALVLPKINPIAIEKGFAKKYGDVPTIGFIDLIDEQSAVPVPGNMPELAEFTPKKNVVADLKTTTKKWSDNALKTNTQLTMYALNEGTPDVRVDQLVMLKNGPVYVRGESTRTPQDGAVFIEDINEVASLIKKGVFPKTTIDHWKCNAKMCPYWANCRGKKKTP